MGLVVVEVFELADKCRDSRSCTDRSGNYFALIREQNLLSSGCLLSSVIHAHTLYTVYTHLCCICFFRCHVLTHFVQSFTYHCHADAYISRLTCCFTSHFSNNVQKCESCM